MMTTRTTIRRWFVAPLLVGALTLTACGSDDDADATPAGEETDAATSTAGEAETSDTPDSGEFCTALADYAQSAGPDAITDPADLERLAGIAPQEIAGDFQDLADMSAQGIAFDEMTASEEEIAEFGALLEEFDPVAARVEAWTAENCPDVELD
jgi:hypothetical protein